MPEYKVHLTWEVYGYVCVEAESKEAAIEYQQICC